MFRMSLLSILLLCLATRADDQSPKPEVINFNAPGNMGFKTGQIGRFEKQGGEFYFQVLSVMGPKDILVFPVAWRRGFDSRTGQPAGRPMKSEGKPFWVTGMSTKDIVDGAHVELSQAFEVKGTKRYDTSEGARTVFLLQLREDIKDEPKPEPKPEPAVGPKEKTKVKSVPAPEPAAKLPDDPVAAAERRAVLALRLAKEFLDDPKTASKGRQLLLDVIDKYPKTKAADEARKLLEP